MTELHCERGKKGLECTLRTSSRCSRTPVVLCFDERAASDRDVACPLVVLTRQSWEEKQSSAPKVRGHWGHKSCDKGQGEGEENLKGEVRPSTYTIVIKVIGSGFTTNVFPSRKEGMQSLAILDVRVSLLTSRRPFLLPVCLDFLAHRHPRRPQRTRDGL